jgi:hypothetical protein
MNRYEILLGKKPPPRVIARSEIIEFCEAPPGTGLGFGHHGMLSLTPVQRMIFKCLYNTPLDDVNETIIVRDEFNETERYRFTEAEYLKFLHQSGRSNMGVVTGDPEDSHTNLLLMAGRRSFKTSTAAIITCFELHKLLQRYCPQEHYGIFPDDEIRINLIGHNRDSSTELLRRVSEHLGRSRCFPIHGMRNDAMAFTTERDRELTTQGSSRPSVVLVASGSPSRLRGSNTFLGVLDEYGFFEAGNQRDVFNSISPVIFSTFRAEESPGRVICVSSPPRSRNSYMFDLYTRQSLDSDWLKLSLPTWECNPTIPPEFLHRQYEQLQPEIYACEFGARI